MSKLPHQHPDEIQLLRLADGELPPPEARGVRTHLETCWQCRTALEDLEATVARCVRYRTEIHTYLPSPPAPWMDIYAAFSRADAAAERATFFSRVFAPFRQVSWWPVPAAIAAALVAMTVYQLHETPAVQAATLLRKAVAAETAKPAAVRRVRIRTGSRDFTRTIGRPPLAGTRAATEAESAIAPLFAPAHYNWDDPLSARTFQAWRDQLPEKRDEVRKLSRQGNGSESYQVRTETGSGELAAASLTLSATDFHPVQGRLEFRNREWVELTELAPEAATPATAAAANETAVSPSLQAPATPGAEVVTSAPPASLGDELQVMATLHSLGADLGDPVEVHRTGGQIVVSGVGVAPQRERQIRQALGTMPRVVMQFSAPAAAPNTGGTPPHPVETPPGDDGLRFQQRMERQLGGHVFFERLSAQLLDLNEAAMARAYALRRLAQQFPAQAGTQLSAGDRRTLVRLGREHAEALLQAESQIEHLLHPVLTPLGGTANAVQQSMSAAHAWQPATEELFRDARHVETLLAAMLDVSPRIGSNQDLPSQVLTGLAQLRASLDNYQRLLAMEPGGAAK